MHEPELQFIVQFNKLFQMSQPEDNFDAGGAITDLVFD